MGLTIKEVVEKMRADGYKLTENTLKYYLSKDLLPEPKKIGKYGKGVKLVFREENEILSRLRKIFELKGKGYKLSDISKEIEREKIEELYEERKKELNGYFEKDGNFYEELDLPPTWEKHNILEVAGDDLRTIRAFSTYDPSNFLFHDATYERSGLRRIGKGGRPVNALKEVLQRGLFATTLTNHGNLIYLLKDFEDYISPWIKLIEEYPIELPVLEALSNKHKENLQNLCYWPEPDGVRFTVEYIENAKRIHLNGLGGMILNYITWIREGFVAVFSDGGLGGFFSPPPVLSFVSDFKYDSVDGFIEAFLQGECAFVSQVTTPFFLAKLRKYDAI